MHGDKLAKGKPLFAVECLPKLAHVVGMAATLVVREVGVEAAAFHKERQRLVDGLGGAGGKRGVARADAAAVVDVWTRGMEKRSVLV